MVVGGEVVTLKSIEESSGLVIAEMPINVSFSVAQYLLIYSGKWIDDTFWPTLKWRFYTFLSGC